MSRAPPIRRPPAWVPLVDLPPLFGTPAPTERDRRSYGRSRRSPSAVAHRVGASHRITITWTTTYDAAISLATFDLLDWLRLGLTGSSRPNRFGQCTGF